MNFMGLGFSFGAKDGGLNTFLKKTIGLSDQVARGIRSFGTVAEQTTKPLDDLVQAMGKNVFTGLADGMEKVTSTLETGVFETLLHGTKIVRESEQSYTEAGSEIGLAFDNIKGSVMGLYHQLVGDRLKKFSEQIPVKKFQEMGARMSAALGIANRFGTEIASTTDGMTSVDNEVQSLAKSIGSTLPKNARAGAERFKRSGDSIGGMQHSIAHGFDLVKEGVSKLNDILKINKLQAFLQAVSLHKMGEVANGLAHIGSQGNNLTTSYEAMAQASYVSSRKIVAATGMFGKELDVASSKASGLSIGMKVSEQTAGHAVVVMKQYGAELKAFGIDSVETGIKVEDGLGIPIQDLAGTLHKMKVSLNLTDKQFNELSKSAVATGETIHDLGGPIKNLDAMTEIAARGANLVAQGFGNIGGADVIKSINDATQSLFILTGDAKASQEVALGFQDKLTASVEDVGKMFGGTQNDLNKLTTNMAIVTGDVYKSFDIAKQGVGGFVKSFAGNMAKMKAKGMKTDQFLRLFRAQLEEAVGPEMADKITTAMTKADKATLESMANIKKSGRTIGEAGKEAWKSSMTLQESYDLMIGSAEARFRNLGRVTAQTFVKDMGASFSTFNNKAEKLSKEGGPLGMLVDKMSQISFIGAKALLPEALRPMAQIFAHISPMVFEAVSAFASMGPVLMGLINPFTLVIGAFALLHMGVVQTRKGMAASDKEFVASKKRASGLEKELKNLQKGTFNYTVALGQLGAEHDKQKKIEESYTQASQKAFAHMLGDKIKTFGTKAKMLIDAVPGILKEVGAEFQQLKDQIDWKSIWASVMTYAKKALSSATQAASGMVEGFFHGFNADTSEGKSTSSKLGLQIGSMLKAAFEEVKGMVHTYFTNWWKNMGSLWSDSSKPFGEKVGETATGSAGILIGAFALGRFAPVFKVIGSLTSMIGPLSGALETIVAAGAGLLGVSTGVFVAIAAVVALTAAFVAFPEEANAAVDKVSNFLHDALSNAAEYATTWFINTVIKGWRTLPGKTADVLWKVVKAFSQVMDIVPKLMLSIVDGIIDGIHNAFSKAFPEYKGAIDNIFGLIKGFADMAIGVLRMFTNPIGAIIDGFKLVGKAASAIWEGIKGVWDNVKGFFSWLYTVVDEAFGHSWFTDAFITAFDKVTGLFNSFGDLAGKIFDGLKGLVSAALSPITSIFDKIFGDGPKSAPDQINEGLTQGFVGAFKTSLMDTKRFLKTEEDLFVEMTKNITNAFKQMWHATLEDASEAVENGLKPTIGSAMEDLRQLQLAVESLKSVKTEMAKAEAAKRQTAEGKSGNQASPMAASVTTGIGDWWTTTGHDDYKDGVDKIVAAIAAIKMAPAAAAGAGNAGAAGALAKTGRFAVGGKPGSSASAVQGFNYNGGTSGR